MDCIKGMKKIDDNSIDAIVTDPPYGLSFMGRDWDEFTSKGYQEFSEKWGKEALRILKPGGHLLAFSGTRTYHRMVCGLEDAGFEIRDTIAWMYGTGFPKSHNISKGIDASFGKSREVVGYTEWKRGKVRNVYGDGYNVGHDPITAPATKEAIQWEGWGTALKPSFEPIIYATKPLNTVTSYKYYIKCQLKLFVRIAENISKLNHQDINEEMLNSALKNAGLKYNTQVDLKEVMDISQSKPKTISIALNTISLWRKIWEEISNKMNKFTTSMKKEMITDLKILSWLLGQVTYQSIIYQLKSNLNGQKSNVTIVEKLLKEGKKKPKDALNFIAQEIATLNQKGNGISVENVVGSSQQMTLLISSVLLNVLIDLTTEKERRELNIFVNIVEKSLKQLLVENQNIVQENVWEKHLENLNPNSNSIVVARKPFKGSVAENVLKYGTGGLNIDASRIGDDEREYQLKGGENLNKLSRPDGNDADEAKGCGAFGRGAKQTSIGTKTAKGRFPTNVILDSESAEMLDEQSGELTSGETKQDTYGDSGGASRFFYCPKVHSSERNAGLYRKTESKEVVRQGLAGEHKNPTYENDIVSLKPINLMRYLIRLVTPPKGVVLDPFAGSGTTACACVIDGFKYILFEKRERFAKEIIPRRIKYWEEPNHWKILNEHTLLPTPTKTTLGKWKSKKRMDVTEIDDDSL